MEAEARGAAEVVARLMAQDEERYEALGAYLRSKPPGFGMSLARGSSDHAAAFGAYLIMQRTGRVVASLPPSILTLFGAELRCAGALAYAVSQSGQSPDIIAPIRQLRGAGATTIAFTNDVQSPLARAAEHVLSIHAGLEHSVAATKSFIASIVGLTRLVAHWMQDADLRQALAALPDQLRRAAALDWSKIIPELTDVDRAMILARGYGLPIAQEAALKLKETCGIQAEAFSSAEVQHGPMALVGPHYPVLVLAPPGPGQEELLALARDMKGRGVKVMLAAPASDADVPLEPAADPAVATLLAIQPFYIMAAHLAAARGLDPDSPPNLKKVTRTL
jgi:glucosamine--fructose-6-phosphate aminotransferase (isomerizing)